MALICQLAIVALVLLAPCVVSAQEKSDLDFLAAMDEFHDIRKMLPARLAQEVNGHLRKRAEAIAKISTLDDLSARRKLVRATILESIGGLPERTPLNARTTGTLDRSDYKIEKIVFESQPHFYVTANLYLPKTGHAPYPAILFPLGHEIGGKSHFAWQQVLGSLARRRFALILIAIFGGLAAFLTASGIFAVLSQSVNARVREFGVRAAVGARPRDVLSMILREAFLLALPGLFAGLVLTFSFARIMRTLVYQLSPMDPVSLASAGGALLLLILFSAWLPARRAASVDPMQALRSD